MADALSKKIRQARDDANMSREKLAAEIGVSLVTVVRLETGRTKQISTERLLAVAKATKKPLSYFLGKVAA